MYEAAKEDTPSHTPYHPGGGVSFLFNVFLDKTLEMYKSYKFCFIQYGFLGGIRPLAVSRFNTDLLK